MLNYFGLKAKQRSLQLFSWRRFSPSQAGGHAESDYCFAQRGLQARSLSYSMVPSKAEEAQMQLEKTFDYWNYSNCCRSAIECMKTKLIIYILICMGLSYADAQTPTPVPSQLPPAPPALVEKQRRLIIDVAELQHACNKGRLVQATTQEDINRVTEILKKYEQDLAEGKAQLAAVNAQLSSYAPVLQSSYPPAPPEFLQKLANAQDQVERAKEKLAKETKANHILMDKGEVIMCEAGLQMYKDELQAYAPTSAAATVTPATTATPAPFGHLMDAPN
jgi:hypothetical protein